MEFSDAFWGFVASRSIASRFPSTKNRGCRRGRASRRSRLVVVRWLLSLVLAVSVAVSSAAVSAPHVHAYRGHDHPEHQHGPASHAHEHHHGSPATLTHADHDAHEDEGDVARIRVEACDAGDHAIRISGAAAPVSQAHVHLAVLSGPIVVAPAVPARLAIAPLDVRVHGPPPKTLLPARAPPLTLLA